MLIYIEGNIGSGKSTFIDLMREHLSKFETEDVEPLVVLEPVDEWMKTEDADGKNILEKFYGDQEKWSFAFQMNSFISRIKRIEDMDSVPEGKESLIFAERSIYTDKRCFAELCYENGKMTKLEYDVYCRWNNWLSEEFAMKPDAYIYLRCYPNVNHDRIEERSREGEGNIPIEYLQALHDKHDSWMAEEKETIPVFTIDSTENFKDKKVMEKIIGELVDFVKSVALD